MIPSTSISLLLLALATPHALAQGALRLRNLDSLPGHPTGVAPDGILWKTPWSDQALRVPQSAILDIELAEHPPHDFSGTHVRLALTNGDLFDGSLAELNREAVAIDTFEAGQLVLPRKMAGRLDLHQPSELIYRGPVTMAGWEVSPAGSWTSESFDFRLQNTGVITRDIGPAAAFRAAFDVEWSLEMNLECLFFARPVKADAQINAEAISDCFRIRIRPPMVSMATEHQEIQADTFRLPDLRGAKRVRLEVFADRVDGTICLHVNERLMAHWLRKIPNEKFTGSHFGFAGEARDAPMRISSIEINTWDGLLETGPPDIIGPCPPELDLLVLRNGDQVRGGLHQILGEQAAVTSLFGPLSIPQDRLRTIEFNAAGRKRVESGPREVRAWFQDGRPVVFSLVAIETNQLMVKSRTFGSTRFNLSDIRRIEFNIQEPSLEALRQTRLVPNPVTIAPVTGTAGPEPVSAE